MLQRVKNNYFLLAFVLTAICVAFTTMSASAPQVTSTRKIWDASEHNAFTDMIRYQGLLFLTFRESDAHVGGTNGTIRILMSKDGEGWSKAAYLKKPGIDLRDPMLSQMPDGRLMLSIEGAVYDKTGKILKRSPYAAFSTNGLEWGPIIELGMHGEWPWKLTWHEGTGYVMSYFATDINNKNTPWGLKLFKTTDGLQYELVKTFALSNYPSEAALQFTRDGTLVALLRKGDYAMIGHAKAPYTEWKWIETKVILGGPDFVILPNGDMWASARKVELVNGIPLTSTILAKMTLSSFEEVLELDSGGDTGYPGLVYENGKLLISYYSSHDGKASIYFAVIDLKSD